ncbi:MAG: nuclear transport factor 2 family protein [Anaerolineae bacterium]
MAESIQQLFERREVAGQAFFAGDPAPIFALWSRADDVTIFGGSGSAAKGWAAVKPRLEYGAAMFKGGRGSIEPVVLGESGDLGYLVCVERGEARSPGSEESRPVALRVTEIFRREDGEWKIIHRHADVIVDRPPQP